MPSNAVAEPMTDTDLRAQVAVAEAEMVALEHESLVAKPAELGRVAAALATARALLDVTTRRLKAAVARQEAADRAVADAERTRTHKQELDDLAARVQAADASWLQWGESATAIEASVAGLWQRYHGIQTEVTSIAVENAALGANLAPPNATAEASAFVSRARGTGHASGIPTGGVRFGTVTRQGLSYNR